MSESNNATSESPRVACVTMVFNEGPRLGLWLAHYGRQFGREHLYVIDDGSTDGSTSGTGANIVKIPKLPFSDARRATFISDFQKSLLAYYDVVIFTDADEILVPDPAHYAGLRDYVERKPGTHFTAVGLNLYPSPSDGPAPLDWSKPLLAQRRTVRFASSMCKTLIARVPMHWGPGFHGSDPAPAVDKDLYLFHLKYADLDAAVERLSLTRDMAWDPEALRLGYGAHQRIDDQALVRKVQRMTDPAHAGRSEFSFDQLLAEATPATPANPGVVSSMRGNIFGPLCQVPERFVGCF